VTENKSEKGEDKGNLRFEHTIAPVRLLYSFRSDLRDRILIKACKQSNTEKDRDVHKESGNKRVDDDSKSGRKEVTQRAT
jgi:hypothetical protein